MKRIGMVAIGLALGVVGGASATITTNLLVRFEGALSGSTYTLGAGEIDTTASFGANGSPVLTNILGEVHAYLDGSGATDANADGFRFNPTTLGDLVASNWVAEMVIAYASFGSGQRTMMNVLGDTDFRINNAGTELEALYWDGSTAGRATMPLPATRTFVHLALVWDPVATALTAYVNGVESGHIDNDAFRVPDPSNVSFGYLGRSGLVGRGVNGWLHAVAFSTSDSAITTGDFAINELPEFPVDPLVGPVVTWDETVYGIESATNIFNGGLVASNLTVIADKWPSGAVTNNAAGGAVNFGGMSVTLNGVDFTGPSASSSYDPTFWPTTGDSDLDELLGTHRAFGTTSDPWMLVIKGLEPETEYQIQLIGIHDVRAGIDVRTYDFVDLGGGENSPTLQRGTGGSIYGTFTTAVDETSLTLKGLVISGPDPGASGLVVRKMYTPPEPAVVAVAGPGSGGGSGLVVMWTGEAGRSYTVETNDNLVSGTWSAWLSDIAGVAGAMSVTNTPDAPQTFFRVVTE